MNEVLNSLVLIFEIENILAIFIGVAFGVFMGAIPGLTGTMGIALIIPLTYSFSPITAFCLLLGTYKGALFGGSIPAILLNTPGSPAAAATILDGYPLSQQGRSNEAMGIALWASVIGDIIATIALILCAVLLAKVATKFGPAEFATLVLFSLTIVAGVSGNSLIKGMIAAAIGFIFATVGLDPMIGTPRFTFGSITLFNGISIMAMLIGLFAISELFIQAEHVYKKDKMAVVSSGSNITFRQVLSRLKTIVRGSIIGIILGAIPGLGATPAAFLSYSEAKRKSKTPEQFGEGSLEGVAAAESANNATCGGALIPLLALGVPGDVTTAILLGAFLIHGLAPGPTLFTDNMELVYALFIGLLIASLLLPLIGLISIKLFSKIIHIPRYILYPLIGILCVMGVYGFNSSVTDIGVMVIFGVLGYLMRKLEFPLAPMMIGFVLEPIGEQSMRQALTISSGSWNIFISTPISITFLCLTILSVFFLIKRKIKE